MSRTAATIDYLSPCEVKLKMRMMAGSLKMQKWLVIYNSIIDPRSASRIALHTGLSEESVHRIIAEYNEFGPEAIEMPGGVRGKVRKGEIK